MSKVNYGVSLTLESNQFQQKANEATRALDKLGKEANKLGGSYNELPGSINKFSSSLDKAKTSSLALISTMAGIGVSAFNTISYFREVSKEVDKTINLLKTASGSANQFASNFQLLSKTANDYGRDITALTYDLAKFYQGMKVANLPNSSFQTMFQDLAYVSSALALTNDQTNSVFRAFNQMASKGAIMSQELKLQLAEQVPFALVALQNVVGKTGKAFNKELESSKLTLEKFGVAWTEEMRRLAGKLPDDTIQFAQNRLKNTAVDLSIRFNLPKLQQDFFNFLNKLLSQVSTRFNEFFYTIVAIATTIGGKKLWDKFLSIGEDSFVRYRQVISKQFSWAREEAYRLQKDLDTLRVSKAGTDANLIQSQNKLSISEKNIALQPVDSQAYISHISSLNSELAQHTANLVDYDRQLKAINSSINKTKKLRDKTTDLAIQAELNEKLAQEKVVRENIRQLKAEESKTISSLDSERLSLQNGQAKLKAEKELEQARKAYNFEKQKSISIAQQIEKTEKDIAVQQNKQASASQKLKTQFSGLQGLTNRVLLSIRAIGLAIKSAAISMAGWMIISTIISLTAKWIGQLKDAKRIASETASSLNQGALAYRKLEGWKDDPDYKLLTTTRDNFLKGDKDITRIKQVFPSLFDKYFKNGASKEAFDSAIEDYRKHKIAESDREGYKQAYSNIQSSKSELSSQFSASFVKDLDSTIERAIEKGLIKAGKDKDGKLTGLYINKSLLAQFQEKLGGTINFKRNNNAPDYYQLQPNLRKDESGKIYKEIASLIENRQVAHALSKFQTKEPFNPYSSLTQATKGDESEKEKQEKDIKADFDKELALLQEKKKRELVTEIQYAEELIQLIEKAKQQLESKHGVSALGRKDYKEISNHINDDEVKSLEYRKSRKEYEDASQQIELLRKQGIYTDLEAAKKEEEAANKHLKEALSFSKSEFEQEQYSKLVRDSKSNSLNINTLESLIKKGARLDDFYPDYSPKKPYELDAEELRRKQVKLKELRETGSTDIDEYNKIIREIEEAAKKLDNSKREEDTKDNKRTKLQAEISLLTNLTSTYRNLSSSIKQLQEDDMSFIDSLLLVIDTISQVISQILSFTSALETVAAVKQAISSASIAQSQQEQAEAIKTTSAHSGEAIASATKEGAKMPFPYNIAAIAAGVAAVIATLSLIPKFETGGIVGGSSYTGDKILARVNSGELILNKKQQKSLFNLISSENTNLSVNIQSKSKISGHDLELLAKKRERLNKRT